MSGCLFFVSRLIVLAAAALLLRGLTRLILHRIRLAGFRSLLRLVRLVLLCHVILLMISRRFFVRVQRVLIYIRLAGRRRGCPPPALVLHRTGR